jgi:transposase
MAFKALDEIGKIYAIEAQVKGLDPGKRLEARQNESKPLVEALFIWLKKASCELPHKSATAKAIAYALNHQAALQQFLADGKIEIDNNAAERAMRAIAIGRKNWLFAGSDAGGEAAAAIYTLIVSVRRRRSIR